jgi:hypothetical protein
MRAGARRILVTDSFFAVLVAFILPTACVHKLANCYWLANNQANLLACSFDITVILSLLMPCLTCIHM